MAAQISCKMCGKELPFRWLGGYHCTESGWPRLENWPPAQQAIVQREYANELADILDGV